MLALPLRPSPDDAVAFASLVPERRPCLRVYAMPSSGSQNINDRLSQHTRLTDRGKTSELSFISGRSVAHVLLSHVTELSASISFFPLHF